MDCDIKASVMHRGSFSSGANNAYSGDQKRPSSTSGEDPGYEPEMRTVGSGETSMGSNSMDYVLRIASECTVI